MGQLTEVRKGSRPPDAEYAPPRGWPLQQSAAQRMKPPPKGGKGPLVLASAGSAAAGAVSGYAFGRRRSKDVAKGVSYDSGLERTGVFKGQSRGMGRREKTDGMTSRAVVVRTPTLREINGRFAGQGPGVKVFHPSGARGSVHTAGLFRATKKPGLVKKDDEPRKGMLGPVDLAYMAQYTNARVGHRLVQR